MVDYYHQTLLQDQEALDYLARRGLRDDHLIRHLRLGYANRTLGYRLPSRNSSAGQSIRKRLQGLGILRPTGHEHLSGSLVVPVLGADGRVVDLYGRKVSTKLRGGTPLHLFLHDSAPLPWLLDPTAASDTMIVTGSVMDALSWWTSGLHLVLVTPTMDPDLAGILAHKKTVQRVVLAYPRRRAIDDLAQPITGADVFRVVLPEGKDANDILTEGRDLQALVRNAEWISGRPASAPEPAPHDVDLVPQGDEVVIELGDRRWRIRGLSANKTPEAMRVNVMVTREDAGMHVDTFDLYSSRHRTGFVKEAVTELGLSEQVVKADLGKVVVHLEELQDKALSVQDPTGEPPRLTPEQQSEAVALLKSPDLINRVADDMTTVGLVGEQANKLIVYLAATSRLLHDPLAVVIQSTSGSGKSTLLDGVLKMMPDEAKKSFSAMTGQSLYYLGQDDLKHKILSVSEEQGASRASYSLKL
ncbi:MAG: DNA primase, partial [Deltaproteobacteria bacterium HGW-Deltaproteobacteria-20]